MYFSFQKKKELNRQINIEEEVQKNKILKGVDTEKKHQHDKLMDEFRKAHRKMFNTTLDDSTEDEKRTEDVRNTDNKRTEKETTIAVSI